MINEGHDKNHPDESREGNYPLILLLGGEAIGVIRVEHRLN